MRALTWMAAVVLPLCIFCQNPLTPSINDIMSLEDQKTTGVIRLTQEQKKALAEWFVKHGYFANQANVNYNQSLTVSINIADGKKIVLSDNSVWDVAPEDQQMASSWLGAQPVAISSSDNTLYPFLMTNMRTNTSIKVKKSTL